MSADEKGIAEIQKEQELKKREIEHNREARERLIEQARALEEEKKRRPVKLKTRYIPAVVTLIGGAAAAIVVGAMHFEIHVALLVILVGLLVFLIMGDVLKYMLDKIELPPEKEEDEVGEDGEMIEKGPLDTEQDIDSTAGYEAAEPAGEENDMTGTGV